jgi:hypothetical protein
VKGVLRITEEGRKRFFKEIPSFSQKRRNTLKTNNKNKHQKPITPTKQTQNPQTKNKSQTYPQTTCAKRANQRNRAVFSEVKNQSRS